MNTKFLPVLSLLILFGINGCSNTGYEVVPLHNHEVATLSVEDLVFIMMKAGFTDEQIHEFGPEIRDALATSGATQVRLNGIVQTTFTIDGGCVFVSSPRGTFMRFLKQDPFENQ